MKITGSIKTQGCKPSGAGESKITPAIIKFAKTKNSEAAGINAGIALLDAEHARTFDNSSPSSDNSWGNESGGKGVNLGKRK